MAGTATMAGIGTIGTTVIGVAAEDRAAPSALAGCVGKTTKNAVAASATAFCL
jgi:hypothetical protein